MLKNIKVIDQFSELEGKTIEKVIEGVDDVSIVTTNNEVAVFEVLETGENYDTYLPNLRASHEVVSDLEGKESLEEEDDYENLRLYLSSKGVFDYETFKQKVESNKEAHEKKMKPFVDMLNEAARSEKRQLLLEAASKLPSFKMSKEEFIKWLEEEY